MCNYLLKSIIEVRDDKGTGEPSFTLVGSGGFQSDAVKDIFLT